MDLIQLTLDPRGVAYVTLNRPDKRNALSFAMLQQLVEIAKQLKSNRQVRCVILQGSSGVFSAGIDLGDLNNGKKALYAAWQLIKPGQSLFQEACLIWQTLPVPVIAVLEGYCLGAGLQLAAAADIRIAAPATQLSIMETRWGLVPDMGLTRSLQGLLRADQLRELTYTARIFDATEAQSLGLVTHVNEAPCEQAEQLVSELLTRSPDALQASKRVLLTMLQRPDRALRLEKLWQLRLLMGKNSRLARQKDRQPDIQFLPRQFGG